MLMCTLLTFAMCANPGVASAMVVGDLTVPIVWSHARIRSCLEVGEGSSGDAAGFTRIETSWSTQQSALDSAPYTGRVTMRIDSARIEMKAYSWNHMSAAEVAALRRLERAALWHELGHVETALNSIRDVNAHGEFSAATPAGYTEGAKQRGDAAFAAFSAGQIEYDRLVTHGLRQDALPSPLGGANTVISCVSR
jgi:hypothetical protein